MLTFGAVLEPLTLYHDMAPDKGTAVQLFGQHGTHAVANGGYTVSCQAGFDALTDHVSGTAGLEMLFVCAPSDHVPHWDSILVANLRRAHRKGVRIVGLGNAGWIFASMGMLDDAKATVHWNTLAAFSEEHALVDIEDGLFTSYRTVTTSGGETAALDVVLDLIAEECPDSARQIAGQLLVSVRRDGKTIQPCGELARRRTLSEPLACALSIMADTLEEPITTSELALRCRVSSRQLERLFRATFETTPLQYYRQLRLEKAHQLVTFTNLPLLEIALATGFSSKGLLSKKFRAKFGTSPCQLRATLDYMQTKEIA